MVEYVEEGLFPAPREAVWKLLEAHRDDRAICAIHHLMLSQVTVSRTESESIVDRIINVRGKSLRSRWKLTYRPPEWARWEVLTSDGPWSGGSFIENSYTEAPGGTLIRSRGDLHIGVLPFFLSQRRTIRRVLSDIHDEDLAYLQR